MKVTYEKWLKSPFGTQGLPPENPRTRHIYITQDHFLFFLAFDLKLIIDYLSMINQYV